mgnify:CR=1 FL=1
MDDVDLLRARGSEEEYVCLVDSAKRDKRAWRTPAEYQVTFDRAFENVVGIAVSAAALPRPQYAVRAGVNDAEVYRFLEPRDVHSAPGSVPASAAPWLRAAQRRNPTGRGGNRPQRRR